MDTGRAKIGNPVGVPGSAAETPRTFTVSDAAFTVRAGATRESARSIIDPTKVVRVALQNAASVAALMLTTEAAIAQHTSAPEPA
jgi:chaperonin GroEL (HSP60 family)